MRQLFMCAGDWGKVINFYLFNDILFPDSLTPTGHFGTPEKP